MAIKRTRHTLEETIAKLKAFASDERRTSKAHFGIETAAALGVTMPEIRGIAKEITLDPELAGALWDSGIHEARILASLVDDPKQLTRARMDSWVAEMNSWDICDQACGNLFDKHPDALAISRRWIDRDEEFVKRAGFVVPTWHSVHHKKLPDDTYLPYFDLIERESSDPRNFVKKAVNWSLRQFGKRSAALHAPALALAQKLSQSDNATARWIGKDAAKELDGEKIRARLGI